MLATGLRVIFSLWGPRDWSLGMWVRLSAQTTQPWVCWPLAGIDSLVRNHKSRGPLFNGSLDSSGGICDLYTTEPSSNESWWKILKFCTSLLIEDQLMMDIYCYDWTDSVGTWVWMCFVQKFSSSWLFILLTVDCWLYFSVMVHLRASVVGSSHRGDFSTMTHWFWDHQIDVLDCKRPELLCILLMLQRVIFSFQSSI